MGRDFSAKSTVWPVIAFTVPCSQLMEPAFCEAGFHTVCKTYEPKSGR
jgi:hypothetical protein